MVKKLSKDEGSKNEQSSRSSRKVIDDYFNLFLKENKNNNKIVFVISKKISKKAVERNRMRRLLQESTRTLDLKMQLVVVVKSNFSKLKKTDVESKILPLIEKLKQ